MRIGQAPRHLLLLAGLRFLARRPWQSALAILGIAAGVGAVTGIDLASASAMRAMSLGVEDLAGPARYEIVGGRGGIDEGWYVAQRRRTGSRLGLVPVVQGRVELIAPRRRLTIYGVDPLAEAASGRAAVIGSDVGDLMTRPGAAIFGEALADRLGLESGDEVQVETGTGLQSLEIVGRLQTQDRRRAKALSNLVVVDIATAQELLGRLGRLDRIDVVDARGEAEDLEALRGRLPPAASLRPKTAHTAALKEITEAFRLNLRALSLLALLVGAFLIYNTMAFAVVQRRSWIGLLRALGTSRRQIGRLILGEALCIGILGTGLGLGLGMALARGLLGLVVGTINDLYFALEVEAMAMHAAPFAKSAALGVGASLLAAVVPAWEAANAPPRRAQLRSELEGRSRRNLPRAAGAGLLAMLSAGALVVAVPRSLSAGFAAVFLAVTGTACLVPATMSLTMRGMVPMLRRGFGGFGALAARGVAATLSRTGVALAALVVAVAAASGVGIMVHSFRVTLVEWLEITLQADVYVTVPPEGRGVRPDLDPAVLRALEDVPGIGERITYRHVLVESPSGPLNLTAVELPRPLFRLYRLSAGRPRAVYDALQAAPTEAGGAVMVSTPLAYRLELGVGDQLRLDTSHGRRGFTVAGVYDDFATDRGVVTMARATYDRFFDDPGIHSLGVFAAPEIGAEDLRRELENRLDGVTGASSVELLPNRALRSLSLDIFDRTFRVTAVLRWVAVAIAFVGVFSSLMALELERGKEHAVLRVLGAQPAQLRWLIQGQTILMGICAGLLAAPLGALLAWLLVHVINRRAFGWTLRLEVSPWILFQGLALAMLAAALAGWWPARRMARANPARAIREE